MQGGGTEIIMKQYKTVKYACYMTNVSMSAAANLSPLLFLTFRQKYGISYTLLGLLVLINFCTQLCVDLIFSFFSHKFNIRKTVIITPALTVVGLIMFALLPFAFPKAVYACFAAGTIVFSAASGLAEVLISPVIAAIPAENPEREMSRLHSVYAWGVVAVVVISTLYLKVFGNGSWQFLFIFWAAVPFIAFLLFLKSDIPVLSTPEKASNVVRLTKNPCMSLCIAVIFLGGASECTMSQWCSSYIENALALPKTIGDIFGFALFAVTLGIGRSLYAKIGKNIYRVLIAGSAGAAVCYLTASLSPYPVAGLAACALTGLCTSMLWPGSLIAMSDAIPNAGIAMFALMAAGGDLGASVAPQLVGIITDAAARNHEWFSFMGSSLMPEQIGMKTGLLAASLFPMASVAVLIVLRKISGRRENG